MDSYKLSDCNRSDKIPNEARKNFQQRHKGNYVESQIDDRNSTATRLYRLLQTYEQAQEDTDLTKNQEISTKSLKN